LRYQPETLVKSSLRITKKTRIITLFYFDIVYKACEILCILKLLQDKKEKKKGQKRKNAVDKNDSPPRHNFGVFAL
jgi:hypothetical protein